MKYAGLSLFCTAVYAIAQQPAGAPYLAWLNEDATYIITDAERSAFTQSCITQHEPGGWLCF
jgi:hypothetical protein